MYAAVIFEAMPRMRFDQCIVSLSINNHVTVFTVTVFVRARECTTNAAIRRETRTLETRFRMSPMTPRIFFSVLSHICSGEELTEKVQEKDWKQWKRERRSRELETF